MLRNRRFSVDTAVTDQVLSRQFMKYPDGNHRIETDRPRLRRRSFLFYSDGVGISDAVFFVRSKPTEVKR